jgi:hypothetical protein
MAIRRAAARVIPCGKKSFTHCPRSGMKKNGNGLCIQFFQKSGLGYENSFTFHLILYTTMNYAKV